MASNGRATRGAEGAPECVDVLGVEVAALSRAELLRRAEAAASDASARRTVMYANVHVVNRAQTDPALRRALVSADWVYCDGEGVRLGARLLGSRLPERMTGADFIDELAARCAARAARIFWLGGRPGVAAQALELLAQRSPGLELAGSHHGYFDRHGPESDEVIARINQARPQLLLVGMGTPAQETWVARNRDAIEAPLVWCIGATADFITGEQPRAPRWMSDNGLEWLYRLLDDPRRLFRRYVVGNPLFVLRVLGARLRRGGHRAGRS